MDGVWCSSSMFMLAIIGVEAVLREHVLVALFRNTGFCTESCVGLKIVAVGSFLYGGGCQFTRVLV